MARIKRKSKAAEKAATRAAALSSISPTLDLGNGLTLAAYNAAIDAIAHPLTGKLALYNAALSTLDAQLADLRTSERALNTMGETMLAGVGVKYGFDSDQYEQGGGVRKSDRKRPVRKAKPVKTP